MLEKSTITKQEIKIILADKSGDDAASEALSASQKQIWI